MPYREHVQEGNLAIPVNRFNPGSPPQPCQLTPSREIRERFVLKGSKKNFQQEVFGILLIRHLLTQILKDGDSKTIVERAVHFMLSVLRIQSLHTLSYSKNYSHI